MTVTDPRGDPSLLQTVVKAEHDRLEQLLEEASRDTSGTPGVHELLVRRLHASLAEHFNTEAALIHPEVVDALGEDDVEALHRDTREIRLLLERRAVDSDLEWVRRTFHHHVDTSDALLAELRAAIGGHRMATLGFEYGRVAEAAPSRISPA